MESYTGFRSVPKSVTLSDLERPNDRHCTLFHTFGANCVKVAEAKPIRHRQKCSQDFLQ